MPVRTSAPVPGWRRAVGRVAGVVAAVAGAAVAALIVAWATAGHQPDPVQLPPYPAPVTTPARAPAPPPALPHRMAPPHERNSSMQDLQHFFGGDPDSRGVTVVDELSRADGTTVLDTWRQTSTDPDEWTSDDTDQMLTWRDLCDTRAPLRENPAATDQPAGGDA